MGEIKRINFKSGQFEANGKIYYIQIDKLSYARYQIFEQMSIGFTFGVNFSDIFSVFHKIYNEATSGDSALTALHNVANLSYNQMKAIEDQGEDLIPNAIRVCALVCNTEDEDLTSWDESILKRKSEDFKKEGIAMNDFFFLANNVIEGLLEALNVSENLKGIENIKTKTKRSSSRTNSTKKNSD